MCCAENLYSSGEGGMISYLILVGQVNNLLCFSIVKLVIESTFWNIGEKNSMF